MKMPALLQLLRPHQWVKNLLVFAPLFFSPALVSSENALKVFVGFCSFCALASCVYILNDWCDRASDKKHPEKKHRPLASGTVDPQTAVWMALGLLAAVAWSGFFINVSALWGWILVAYVLLNVSYSLRLKHVPLVDVFIVAAGYVMRVVGGCALLGVEPSGWLITATTFATLFVAFAKRRDDVNRKTKGRKSLEGYTLPFIDAALMMLGTAAVLSYSLYTMDGEVQERLSTTHLYWTVPVVAFAFLRYVQLVLVEGKGGNPSRLFLTDKVLLATLGVWFALCGVLIYGM